MQGTPADWNDLDTNLTEDDRRRVFEACGFEIGARQANREGWVGGLRLPASLGEDHNPSVSVNLTTGAVCDHGSDYRADLPKLVQDVRRVDFNKAVAFIAKVTGKDARHTGAWPTSRANGSGKSGSGENGASAPRRRDRPGLGPQTLEEVEAWSRALLASEDEPHAAALRYLTERRALAPETIAAHRIGLRRLYGKSAYGDYTGNGGFSSLLRRALRVTPATGR